MRKRISMVPALKKILPVVLAAVFSLPLTAQAELRAKSFEVTPFVGFNFFENQQNLENKPVFGGRLGYNLTRRFGIEATGEFIKSSVDDATQTFDHEGQFTSPIDGVRLTMYHLDAVYHFMPEEKFNPFIVAGYGAAHYSPQINDENMSVINFGVGAKYWVAKRIALRADLRDNMVLDERIHNLEATLGVVFAFGGEKKKVAKVVAEPEYDITKPTVIFTSPANGATAAPVNQKINVAFSEEMNPATLTAAPTFTVKQGVTPVAGKVTAVDATATFTPNSALENGKVYTATVTTDARDPSGNPLATNYAWGFTVGPVADTTAPTVIFTSPVKNATAAPVNQKVNVAFSEAIDPATITASTFTLKQGASPVSGKVTAAGAVATFAPSENLRKGQPYTATITTGARDLAGNPLAANYGWGFTAHASPILVPAMLVTLEDSHFLYGRSDITENGKTILNLNIQVLNDNPSMKIRIAGYASAAGTEEYNQKLSEERAAAVKDYLVSGGIDKNRLSTIGYGETSPAEYEAVPSDIYSDAAHANMRVLFEVIVK